MAPFTTLTAARAPSSPRSVTVVVISASQLGLSWMEPESNGGANITRYGKHISVWDFTGKKGLIPSDDYSIGHLSRLWFEQGLVADIVI